MWPAGCGVPSDRPSVIFDPCWLLLVPAGSCDAFRSSDKDKQHPASDSRTKRGRLAASVDLKTYM